MLCPLPSPLLCWQYWWKHLLEQFQVAFLSGPGPLDQAENVCSHWWSVWPRNFLSYSHLLEKAMAPHSSTLAWKIPRTEEPGRLQSVGLLRVRHDWATSPSLLTFMHWRRKWQPTPVFLPGESQGRGSLVGCRLWGCTELDTTEATSSSSSNSHLFHLQSLGK